VVELEREELEKLVREQAREIEALKQKVGEHEAQLQQSDNADIEESSLVSRRDFLKGLGTATAGLGVLSLLPSAAANVRVTDTGVSVDGNSFWHQGTFNPSDYLPLDGSSSMTGNLDVGSNSITNVANVDGVDISSHTNDSSAHHTRYTDSEAISAVNNDGDHGSTASHNYFSGSHSDLTNINSNDHHTKTTSSDITVTDTQTGSVGEGEFLKNEGGNLTGGGWKTIYSETDSDNTTDLSFDTGTISDIKDQYRVTVQVDEHSGSDTQIQLRFNNNSATNYDYTWYDNSGISRHTSRDHFRLMNLIADSYGMWEGIIVPTTTVGVSDPQPGIFGNGVPGSDARLVLKTGKHTNMTPDIDRIQILSNGNVTGKMLIEGRDL
jgi:hypothetical protein